MTILAIETSCDETAIAIYKDKKVKSNIIFSQIANHQQYGGVVPEIASRLHISKISYVLKEAIKQAQIQYNDIDYIGYTDHPGLSGSLHIGKVCAQTISLMLKKPLIACNHIEGHIYSAAINNEFKFPLITLVVSGGHTQLVLMKKHLDFHILGETYDDAVGEAYDKVARLLELEYPGGPIIDKIAKKGQNIFELPLGKNDNSFDFSFSGLKSAVANLIKKLNARQLQFRKEDIACSFQEQATNILIKKITTAMKKYHPKMITVVGGVAANSVLRTKVENLATKNTTVIIPNNKYCTDNAAMIARLTWQIINNRLKDVSKKKK